MKKHIICAEVKADLDPILSGIFSIEGKIACRKTLGIDVNNPTFSACCIVGKNRVKKRRLTISIALPERN
jgi:hypothetical protein